MNFDFGEALRRAWQITWKHKVLWGWIVLPMIPAVFYLPLIFYFFLSTDLSNGLAHLLENPGLIALFFLAALITAHADGRLALYESSFHGYISASHPQLKAAAASF